MMTPQAFFYSNHARPTTSSSSSSSPSSSTPFRAARIQRPAPIPTSTPSILASNTSALPPTVATSSSLSSSLPSSSSRSSSLKRRARTTAALAAPIPSRLAAATPPPTKPGLLLAPISKPSPSRKHDRTPAASITTTTTNKFSDRYLTAAADVDPEPPANMVKRKGVQDRLTPPSSPPSVSMSDTVARPSTASSAVEIPTNSKYDTAHKQHKHRHKADSLRRQQHSAGRRTRDVHSPGSISPSMAALLAITAIPPPRRSSPRYQKEVKPNEIVRMTVDSIVPRSQVSEKELSRELGDEASSLFGPYDSFSRCPMDILLSPPEELEEDVISVNSDGAFTPPFSTRAASFDSIPSLGDSLSTNGMSLESPLTPRGRRFRQPRRSLEPVVSPLGKESDHPLSHTASNDELNFGVFDPSPVSLEKKETPPQLALKSVFKSNLTASLRALRSAAKSLSNFTASSIPPEDFLTRSILTIDPRVPFTDERMPPVLDQEPSEAMRRYLNPTTPVRPESRSGSNVRSYTASIQMQTYKVQKSKTSSKSHQPSKSAPAQILLPGPRQREVRENSDFIRIAVLEHLMRKKGKFDNEKEGHARWVLPPRKMSTKPYKIGPNGVPARWLSVLQDEVV